VTDTKKDVVLLWEGGRGVFLFVVPFFFWGGGGESLRDTPHP